MQLQHIVLEEPAGAGFNDSPLREATYHTQIPPSGETSQEYRITFPPDWERGEIVLRFEAVTPATGRVVKERLRIPVGQ